MSLVFDALADPTRRAILDQLRSEGALSISALTAPLAISRQAVTKHLDTLAGCGLVRVRRSGRERLHELDPRPLADVSEWLAPYEAAWDRRLERLRAYLEDPPE